MKEDYSFGWLVPVFVVYVVIDRWPRILAGLTDAADPCGPHATGWRRTLLKLIIGGSLGGGILLFLVGILYRTGSGTSPQGTLALTVGSECILLALLFLGAPGSGPADGAIPASRNRSAFLADPRLRLVGLFLFPVLVWLISAPLLAVVEQRLNLALLRQVVTVVALVFEVLGLPD